MNIVQLVITFNRDNGEINVTGPIRDKLFCYGMMESAKDAIRDFKESGLVTPAKDGEVAAVNRLNLK